MTVKELRAALDEFPEDALVMFDAGYDDEPTLPVLSAALNETPDKPNEDGLALPGVYLTPWSWNPTIDPIGGNK